MPKTITVDPETVVDEQPVNAKPSRKREITATVTATTVTVLLGLAATGAIERIGKLVKNRIAPEPEKPEDE